MKIYKDYPLTNVLWYRIGGTARYFLEVYNKEDILSAFDFIDQNKIKKYLIIGQGSNLLVSDASYDGAVIRMMRNDEKTSLHLTSDGLIEGFPGELLDDLIHFSFNNSMVGFEWAGGLPGTIGGAIRGNVGAFGGEIKDNFFRAEILSVRDSAIPSIGRRYEQQDFTHQQLDFSYRSSIIKKQKNMVILSATFHFRTATPAEVAKAKQSYQDCLQYRRENNPLEYPSCGSTFKNIVEADHVEKVLSVFPDLKGLIETSWHGKVSTGYLLRKLGFAGFAVGKAQASEKHPNFIINLGGAKFTDVLEVIKAIQEKFRQTFDFIPEVEAEIVQ